MLFLPNYRAKQYDYIVKWCSGVAMYLVCIAGYWLNLSFKEYSDKTLQWYQREDNVV